MQNVIEKASTEQLTNILRELSPHFLELSTHQYGNLVIFDLSESCTEPIHYQIMSDGLRGKITQLCKLKSYKTLGYLLSFPPQYCSFVMGEILPNLKELSMGKIRFILNIVVFMYILNRCQWMFIHPVSYRKSEWTTICGHLAKFISSSLGSLHSSIWQLCDTKIDKSIEGTNSFWDHIQWIERKGHRTL